MKKGFDIISIIFWISIIFYLDPGGFIASSVKGEVDATRSILFKFGVIAIGFALMILKNKNEELVLVKDKSLTWYGITIFIWVIYYFFWFYGFNNSFSVGLLRMITRNQRMVTQILVVFPVAFFASIHLKFFVKFLSWSTIVIMTMFVLTIFFHLNLVEIDIGQRGMGLSVNRYFMFGYGLMGFTIPLAISLLLMKYKNPKLIIVAAAFAAIQTFLSILRRDILGIMEYIVIIAFLVNFIYGSKPFNFLRRFINIKTISATTALIVLISILAPDVIKTSQIIIEETYDRVFLGQGGAESTDEARMSMTAMYGMVKVIEENLFLGAGFLPEFYNEHISTKGIEGADYIFLSAFGMYGLVGLLIFLPFYIITFRVIFRASKLLRENNLVIKEQSQNFTYPVIVFLASASEFIKNIIEYPNWFWPIGASMYSPKFFIYFGLLIGSYYQLVILVNKHRLKLYHD